MSKNNDHEDGYWAGRNGFLRNSNSSEYMQGYWKGRQEYDFWNDKNLYLSLRHNDGEYVKETYDPLTNDTSVFLGMVGGSVVLVILGWCFVGLPLLLFWVGGESNSWWFPWVWRIAFWGGAGSVVVMSIACVILAIIEWAERSAKSKPDSQK